MIQHSLRKKGFFLLICIFAPLPIIADALPFDLLTLPTLDPVLHLESDYELAQTLVEQTTAQLEDLKTLLSDYKNFKELEERFSQQKDNRNLASELVHCSSKIQAILERRHLKDFFSPPFIEQIYFFSKLKRTSSEVVCE